MKKFNSFWIVVLSFAILASAKADPRVLDGTLNYRGEIIQEDDFGAFNGDYINPNENENYLAIRCLNSQDSGSLVSVGTFRALNIAARGSVEDAFQFDFDLLTTFFNHLNHGLILRAENRHEYLSYLLTGELQAKLIRKAQFKKITNLEYMQKLQAIAQKLKPEEYFRRLKKLCLELPTLSKDYAEKIKGRGKDFHTLKEGGEIPSDLLNFLSKFKPEFFKKLDRLTNFFKESSETRRNAFFGNDILFNTVQQMVRDNRIHILVADLMGNRAFNSLTQALNRTGRKVKILDTSNAQGWILNEQPLDRLKKHFQNILQLPFSGEGRIFMTDDFTQNRWKYFVFDPFHLTLIRDRYYSLIENMRDEGYDPEASQYSSAHYVPPTLSEVAIGGTNKAKSVVQLPGELFAQPRALCP